MSRRFKSPTMKFGVPLSVPASRYVEHCYGSHGKGYGRTPPRNSAIALILLNAQRQLWRVEGYFPEPHKYVTDALGLGGDGWKILGWRMADASAAWRLRRCRSGVGAVRLSAGAELGGGTLAQHSVRWRQHRRGERLRRGKGCAGAASCAGLS
jgi:hypothetical protein